MVVSRLLSRWLFLLAAGLGLAACASDPPIELPPSSLAVQDPPPPPITGASVAQRLELERYVRTVFIRLATANADLCRDHVMGEFGIRFATLGSVGRQMRPAAIASGLLSDVPTVFFAGDDLPAEAAGVRIGDRLVAIEGRPLLPGEPAAKTFAATVNAALRKRGAVAFGLVRDGRRFDVALAPVASCEVNVYLDMMPLPNAFTSGDDILVLSGLLRVARTESELAVVIGHELGHVLLDLRAKGKEREPMAEEIAADRLGLYAAARAGYDISTATVVMDRIMQDYPMMASGGENHPSSSVRVAAMQAVQREIAAKRKAGLPLQPFPPES